MHGTLQACPTARLSCWLLLLTGRPAAELAVFRPDTMVDPAQARAISTSPTLPEPSLSNQAATEIRPESTECMRAFNICIDGSTDEKLAWRDENDMARVDNVG